MNEQHATALLQAVVRQRDAAINAAAHLEARLELALADLNALKEAGPSAEQPASAAG